MGGQTANFATSMRCVRTGSTATAFMPSFIATSPRTQGQVTSAYTKHPRCVDLESWGDTSCGGDQRDRGEEGGSFLEVLAHVCNCNIDTVKK